MVRQPRYVVGRQSEAHAAVGNARYMPVRNLPKTPFVASWCLPLLLPVQAEKALLLASLLLGYGLDAWVVLGTDAAGQHTWVLTRSSRETVVFWDACTG